MEKEFTDMQDSRQVRKKKGKVTKCKYAWNKESEKTYRQKSCNYAREQVRTFHARQQPGEEVRKQMDKFQECLN